MMAEKQEYIRTPNDEIDALVDRARDYIDTRLELAKLKTASKSTDVFSSIAAKSAFVFFIVICILVLNIALALMLGDWLGKSYYGFFIMAGLNLITGLIIMTAGKKWIKGTVADIIIKKFFS